MCTQWNINSAVQKNAFESVLMRQMKLEPITQSEAETPIQYIDAYIWIQKDG